MQRSSSPRRKRARAEYSPEPRSSGAAQGAAPSSRPIRAGAKKKPRSAVKLRWTPEEDEVLTSVVEKYGTGNWTFIGQFMAGRTGKQCRERWVNHLKPDIKCGPWSQREDAIIIRLHSQHGAQWAGIAAHLPGRSDAALKNHFHSTCRLKTDQPDSLLKKYVDMMQDGGVEPLRAAQAVLDAWGGPGLEELLPGGGGAGAGGEAFSLETAAERRRQRSAPPKAPVIIKINRLLGGEQGQTGQGAAGGDGRPARRGQDSGSEEEEGAEEGEDDDDGGGTVPPPPQQQQQQQQQQEPRRGSRAGGSDGRVKSPGTVAARRASWLLMAAQAIATSPSKQAAAAAASAAASATPSRSSSLKAKAPQAAAAAAAAQTPKAPRSSSIRAADAAKLVARASATPACEEPAARDVLCESDHDCAEVLAMMSAQRHHLDGEQARKERQRAAEAEATPSGAARVKKEAEAASRPQAEGRPAVAAPAPAAAATAPAPAVALSHPLALGNFAAPLGPFSAAALPAMPTLPPPAPAIDWRLLGSHEAVAAAATAAALDALGHNMIPGLLRTLGCESSVLERVAASWTVMASTARAQFVLALDELMLRGAVQQDLQTILNAFLPNSS